jgi:hypothetical protein
LVSSIQLILKLIQHFNIYAKYEKFLFLMACTQHKIGGLKLSHSFLSKSTVFSRAHVIGKGVQNLISEAQGTYFIANWLNQTLADYKNGQYA